MFHEKYRSTNNLLCTHPIKNDYLYLLYDPINLIKNIRNNWVTEKMQKLFFKGDKYQLTVTAKWVDLVFVYHDEKENDVHMTPLTYASLHPTNFEKQKVSIIQNIFN